MRRRWIQVGLELIEVTPGFQQPSPESAKNAGVLWNDREYQDMGDPRFKSRTEHREYMRQHGLTTSDDYLGKGGQWYRQEELRAKTREGYDPTRREDLNKAVSTLSKG